MSTRKIVLKTIIAMVLILLFYFVAGAAVVMNSLNGAEAKLTQGIFIWLSVLAALLWVWLRKQKLAEIGLQKIKAGSLKTIYYGIPALIIGLLGLNWGIGVTGEGHKYIFASMFLTLGVGFSEEIFFRGIICRLWKEKGTLLAILISSALFGICHLENLLGGADLITTILQIAFAFFYGIVVAQIYLLTESILPCVILHFLHDFFSFIGIDASGSAQLFIIISQTVLLLLYCLLLFRRLKQQKLLEK